MNRPIRRLEPPAPLLEELPTPINSPWAKVGTIVDASAHQNRVLGIELAYNANPQQDMGFLVQSSSTTAKPNNLMLGNALAL